ncbi:hypothetical protein QJS04_geneDACA024753 [Acorus gramineus]|uniref:Uncharacterized protein n=1 Tax=Acorus gramineus TaxID=55184 RepID=A0AAV9AY82_ACOGR|nr:hypothetical protein QJS04_geneDACA024753 [Acorus gramineus]
MGVGREHNNVPGSQFALGMRGRQPLADQRRLAGRPHWWGSMFGRSPSLG